MRALVVLVLACVMHNPAVQSLKCYRCYSSVSWKDCDKSRKEVTCPSGLDRCGYVHAVGEQDIFGRDCESQDKCRTLCKDSQYKVCTAKCCRSDLCNGKRLSTKTTQAPVTTKPRGTLQTTPRVTSQPRATENDALSCYSCESHDSWNDCDKTTRAVTCPVAMDTCVKISVGSVLYKRSCGASDRCHVARENCNRAERLSEDFECGVTCCAGRLCNSSSRANTSSFGNLMFFGGAVAVAITVIT